MSTTSQYKVSCVCVGAWGAVCVCVCVCVEREKERERESERALDLLHLPTREHPIPHEVSLAKLPIGSSTTPPNFQKGLISMVGLYRTSGR